MRWWFGVASCPGALARFIQGRLRQSLLTKKLSVLVLKSRVHVCSIYIANAGGVCQSWNMPVWGHGRGFRARWSCRVAAKRRGKAQTS